MNACSFIGVLEFLGRTLISAKKSYVRNRSFIAYKRFDNFILYQKYKDIEILKALENSDLKEKKDLSVKIIVKIITFCNISIDIAKNIK